MNGDAETVRALLKKGLDVNEAQGDGTTALHWAAMKGDAELAQMLLFAGANLARRRAWGLHAAVSGGEGRTLAVVAALLAAGADPKATTTTAPRR